MCKVLLLLQYIIIISMIAFIQYCTFSRKNPENTMSAEIYYMEIKPDNKRNENKQIGICTAGHILKIDGQTQRLSQNLCFLFVYYVISNKSCVETTLLAIITLLFHKTSAMPIHDHKNSLVNTKSRKRRGKRSISSRKTFNQGQCEENWFENNEQCYRLFHQVKSYRSAKQYCKALEANFPEITSKEQNDYIDNLSNEMKITTYLWISVELSGTYRNWYPGHFDQRNGCVVMVNAGQWKNFDCTYPLPFVCQKAIKGTHYTRETLLIALLVPIFSCISFAVAFTTTLLVLSIRRNYQPFKQASRYAQKKTRRRIAATWEMIDTLRRASLKRRSSKQRSGHNSIPNIEITKPDGETAGKSSKTSWFQKSSKKATDSLQAPAESPNSSLYELLVRLNDMDFARSKYNKAIELHNLKEESHEALDEPIVIKDECHNQSVEQLQNSREKRKNVRKNSERSFRNMAFRDSISSSDTVVDGAVFGKAFMFRQKKLEKQDSRNSNMEDSPSKSNSGFTRKKSSSVSDKDSLNKSVRKKSMKRMHHNSDHEIQNTAHNNEIKMNIETKLKRKECTVKVDVHRMSEESSAAGSKYDYDVETKKKQPIRSIVWTYSI